MKIYIKPNLDKPDARTCAIRTASALREIAARRKESLEILFGHEDGKQLGKTGGALIIPQSDAINACDIMISIGGDGTIMRDARQAAKAGKPILGVNAGNIGFLTQVEANELNELERLFSGGYGIMERMMLEATVENDGAHVVYSALNDVVIRHGDADRIVSIEVNQGDRPIAAYRADGIIFSTPTGSTAYSMSAGGPVVSPELSLILMTAICSHSAFNCSLVLPPDHAYTVREVPAGARHGMYVSLDGQRVDKLKPDGAVTVSRSATTAKFIELGLREFFSNLNQKLSWRR